MSRFTAAPAAVKGPNSSECGCNEDENFLLKTSLQFSPRYLIEYWSRGRFVSMHTDHSLGECNLLSGSHNNSIQA
jgi:hypothetical protein